ncbi:hypothetical protein SAMN05444143_1321, partial [Flavobacterium succinicans]
SKEENLAKNIDLKINRQYPHLVIFNHKKTVSKSILETVSFMFVVKVTLS